MAVYRRTTAEWFIAKSSGGSQNDGVTWSDIVGATAIPYSFTTSASDNGKRFRAVFTNASGSATTNAAILTVTCTATLTPPGSALPSTVGATGSISLTLPLSCPWTATSSQNWLALIGNTSGAGSASITYGTSAPNLLLRPRSATVTVAGQWQSVTQRKLGKEWIQGRSSGCRNKRAIHGAEQRREDLHDLHRLVHGRSERTSPSRRTDRQQDPFEWLLTWKPK